MGTLFTIIQWKCVLIGSICHAEDNGTKRYCTSLPPGKMRGRSVEGERDGEGVVEESIRVEVRKVKSESESKSKKNTEMDQTAESPNTRNLAGYTASLKATGPRMNIVQHSCEASDAGDASFASACHTDRQRKQRWDVVVFDAENESSLILLLWWNAARLEPHWTRYLPLKCSLAGIQIQQGCEKEKDWTWMLTFPFCLNSQRNVGIKVTWFTVRHKKKFYLLHRGPTEIVAESYSNRYMNWRSPFKGPNSLRK